MCKFYRPTVICFGKLYTGKQFEILETEIIVFQEDNLKDEPEVET